MVSSVVHSDYFLVSFLLFRKAFSTVGTPDYIAPEVLLKKGYGMECDWLVQSISILYIKARTIINVFPFFVWTNRPTLVLQSYHSVLT